MSEWDPDVAIDEALVRALLAEQFPELGAQSVALVGEGFDNSVWVIDEEWAFRFPRRAVAVPLVARELAVLPRVAPLVPVPVPLPAYVGAESERFRRPFFGYRLLLGVEPAEARLTRILADAEGLAPSSAEVLLHGDLHVRHVLVDQGSLSGVIDWGDVCVGDPAIDLLLVWSVLPPEGRAEFFDE